MLEAARLAAAYVADKTREEFLEDTQVQDAVVRRLEILGEAARRVSPDGREQFASLPWHQMIGMRNFVIHEYDGVDMHIVWDTVRENLPQLVQSLQDALSR